LPGIYSGFVDYHFEIEGKIIFNYKASASRISGDDCSFTRYDAVVIENPEYKTVAGFFNIFIP